MSLTGEHNDLPGAVPKGIKGVAVEPLDDAGEIRCLYKDLTEMLLYC